MKKSIISLLAFFVSFFSFAQEADQRNFDYQKTRNEFSLDLLPVINGSHPVSLLYRKHYISGQGNNVGLRLGLNVGNNFSVSNTSDNQTPTLNVQSHNYSISIGKERQIPVYKNILSYYGVDFGAGYSTHRNFPTNTDPDATIVKSKSNNFDFSSTGFLGFKYHTSSRFPLGAETALAVSYNHNSITDTFEASNSITKNKSAYNNIGLRMHHIRSLRFAYHF